LVEDGLVEHIGVSNFEPEQLETARSVFEEPIVANQVEMHPLLPQRDLREYLADTDIELVAYSPLARGEALEVPELSSIAEKHGASEAQVSLAWVREQGATAIPKATSEAHIRDNWESLQLELDEDDLATIDGITRTDRRVDPSFAPW
jgi:diketogulonate reductase-like aldo/keto reductase